MKKWNRLIIVLVILFSLGCTENKRDDHWLFAKLFADWSTNFNQKNLTASCDLFDSQVIATYRNQPIKNYQSICDGFARIFKQPNMQYTYDFQLNRVYKTSKLAVVRITWYLTVKRNGKVVEKVTDEGIDILRQSKDGKWRIVEYLAYAV